MFNKSSIYRELAMTIIKSMEWIQIHKNEHNNEMTIVTTIGHVTHLLFEIKAE